MTRNTRKRRWVRWFVPAVAAAAAGGALFFVLGSARQQGATAPRFTTYRVQAVTESNTIEISGNIAPVEEEDLGFSASGKVARVYVKEGDRVRAGTLVAELDNSDQVYALAALDAEIEKTRIAGSKQDLALLELERQSQLTALEDRKLYTTISGVVTSVDIRRGELVKSVNDITPVMHVSNLSAMKADVEIDEIDAPRVAVGQKVTFFFDALPDLQVQGRVSALPIQARVTGSGIAVVDAEVIIDAPPPGLVAGYSFAAEIQAGEPQEILVLEEQAVLERGGAKMVLRAPAEPGGRPVPAPVKTAAYGGGKVRILSGLSAGDLVVVANPQSQASGGSGGTSPLRLLGFPGRAPVIRLNPSAGGARR